MKKKKGGTWKRSPSLGDALNSIGGSRSRSRSDPSFIKTPYFGITLESIMRWERNQDEAALIPTLAKYLCYSLFRLGGGEAEGIFRLSVYAQDLEVMQVDIEVSERMRQELKEV